MQISPKKPAQPEQSLMNETQLTEVSKPAEIIERNSNQKVEEVKAAPLTEENIAKKFASEVRPPELDIETESIFDHTLISPTAQ